jgi:hypothetical protein
MQQQADVRMKAAWTAGYWLSGAWVVSCSIAQSELARLQTNESAWAVCGPARCVGFRRGCRQVSLPAQPVVQRDTQSSGVAADE